jgi:hypothetical protein
MRPFYLILLIYCLYGLIWFISFTKELFNRIFYKNLTICFKNKILSHSRSSSSSLTFHKLNYSQTLCSKLSQILSFQSIRLWAVFPSSVSRFKSCFILLQEFLWVPNWYYRSNFFYLQFWFFPIVWCGVSSGKTAGKTTSLRN